MDWPTLSIMLLTYGGSPERREYAALTLRSTLDGLRYSGPLRVHIADDGSGEDHWRALFDLAASYPHVAGVTATDSARGGYGMSYNMATQIVHREAEIVLPLEDDWELRHELNADPLVEALQDPRIDCIRMGYLGFTHEALHGQVVHVAGGTYFILDPDNSDPDIFAGHPRLELAAWEREVGPWPETESPGGTEIVVRNWPAARKGVVWPMHLARTEGGDVFGHIGTVRSY